MKGSVESVVVTNNRSSIHAHHNLLVRFPKLCAYDDIVPGTAKLAFTINITSQNQNATLVYGQHLNKVSLTPFDSKQFILTNGIDTLAYGYP